MKIFYNPNLKKFAQRLRNNGTLAEVLLWDMLKGSKMNGYRFIRQKPIGNFIVDFVCPKLKLILEIDGESHELKGEKDTLRRCELEKLGFHVLRFSEMDVRDNLEEVLHHIKNWIVSR